MPGLLAEAPCWHGRRQRARRVHPRLKRGQELRAAADRGAAAQAARSCHLPDCQDPDPACLNSHSCSPISLQERQADRRHRLVADTSDEEEAYLPSEQTRSACGEGTACSWFA